MEQGLEMQFTVNKKHSERMEGIKDMTHSKCNQSQGLKTIKSKYWVNDHSYNTTKD